MDYKKMYLILFRAITDVMDILQAAQQKAEEVYIDSSPDISALPLSDSSEPDKND